MLLLYYGVCLGSSLYWGGLLWSSLVRTKRSCLHLCELRDDRRSLILRVIDCTGLRG
ncbi:hypothetical protein BDV29DRAFT_173826 [Aspergillus leporis]|uniref:Uncharacterized protein n=1 Tax=Aspergillus leporis TaxID=41062 RepID=A0A5N5X0S4_9EURO|nr:hypothetical protein BDV29DRAFT_173826 [Aspergillus leporis]